jgi:hypothetical protein
MSDNEHTAASLGHSEILSVKNPVGAPIPELPQPSEEGAKSPCFVRQHSGDVLPNNPAGPELRNKSKKDESEVATRIIQSLSESGNAEGLAGSSSNKKVD